MTTNSENNVEGMKYTLVKQLNVIKNIIFKK